MIRTKVEFMGVAVLLDTDDADIAQRFEHDVTWDRPFLKMHTDKGKKENANHGKEQNTAR